MNSIPEGCSPSAGPMRFEVTIDLWLQTKLVGGGHNATCRCGGIPHMALSPDDIERALLEYLSAKYTTEGRGELLSLVQNRINDGTDEQRTCSFEHWLRSLKNQELKECDRQTLLEDMTSTLSSILNQNHALR